MVHRGMKYEADKDASWGLIYRLNDLWVLAQKKMLAAEFDDWNYVLDAIYHNLSYNPAEPITLIEKDGEIIIKYESTMEKEFKLFNRKILICKKRMREALKNEDQKEKLKNFNFYKGELYRTLELKDMWTRKFMQLLKLYLKQVDKNDPSRAMWNQ